MEDPWRDLLRDMGDRLDADLPGVLYRVASVPSAQVRDALDEEGLAWHDPARDRTATGAELDVSARTVIDRAARKASMRGAVGSFAGLLGVPPEAAAALVQSTRLAQRLAVIYGVDPDTDRGKLLLARALADAWDIELPEQGAWDLKVSDITTLVASDGSQLPDRLRTGARVGRFMLKRVMASARSRVFRVVPGLGTGVAALGARRQLRRQGERMTQVFRRAWEGETFLDGPVTEADEVAAG